MALLDAPRESPRQRRARASRLLSRVSPTKRAGCRPPVRLPRAVRSVRLLRTLPIPTFPLKGTDLSTPCFHISETSTLFEMVRAAMPFKPLPCPPSLQPTPPFPHLNGYPERSPTLLRGTRSMTSTAIRSRPSVARAKATTSSCRPPQRAANLFRSRCRCSTRWCARVATV